MEKGENWGRIWEKSISLIHDCNREKVGVNEKKQEDSDVTSDFEKAYTRI